MRHDVCGKCSLSSVCATICSSYGDEAVQSHGYLRNETFLRRGLDGVLIIRSGLLVVYYNQVDGDRQVVIIASCGDTIGETGALLDGQWDDYILIITDVEACVIPQVHYRAVLKSNPQLLLKVAEASMRNVGGFTYLSWMLQGSNVRDRIERFLAYYYVQYSTGKENNFIVPVSHEMIALIVHSERATVTRALGRMSKDGLIALRAGAIIIKVDRWTESFKTARLVSEARERYTSLSLSLD